MDKLVIDSCYDEEKTAYNILILKKDIRKTLKRHIENKNCPQYYILITKYLLKHNYSINDIKTIIRKHIALVAYMIIREKKVEKVISENEFFNKLLYGPNEIAINLYLNNEKENEFYRGWDNDLFDLYHYDDYQTIKRAIANINNDYEIITGNNNIFTLLNIVLDYFYFGCKFADLKYINHSDLIISYNQNNEQLHSFSFELLEAMGEVYDECYISTQSFKEIDIKERILGHLINIIFINNNLDYKNEMKLLPIYYYEIMFNEARKKILQDAYSFFDVDAKNQTATINMNKIKKSFKFKYNNECYSFTKEGIVKI